MTRDRIFYNNYVLAVVSRGEDVFERAERKNVDSYQVGTSVWALASEGRIVIDEHWKVREI